MQHSTCLFFARVADFDYLQLLYLELLLFDESLVPVSAEQLQLVPGGDIDQPNYSLLFAPLHRHLPDSGGEGDGAKVCLGTRAAAP